MSIMWDLRVRRLSHGDDTMISLIGVSISYSTPGESVRLANRRTAERSRSGAVLRGPEGPHDPAHARYMELYTEAVRRNGGDGDLGRRLPSVAWAAGLRDVHCNVFQPAYTSGQHKQLPVVTMDKIRPAVLRHGLASDQEIDSIVYRVGAFVQDPTTFVAMPRIVQVWGMA
jgi:hypothetical protein